MSNSTLLNQEMIFDTLSNLQGQLLKDFKVKTIGIFGSYARGEATDESDIDVLVDFQEGATLLEWSGLNQFLEEVFAKKIDCVPFDSMREELRPYIMKDLKYMREYKLFLHDILEAIQKVERFVGDMNFEDFIQDEKTQSAVIRQLEIIGEASKQIPQAIREKDVNIPWKLMAGMRDVLIHSYFKVNYQIVWDTKHTLVSEVKNRIQKVMEEV